MKRAVMTLVAASVLGAALPALAGQPIAYFDERYPFATNKKREAFPNAPSGAARAATERPYALTGTPSAPPASKGWRMSVETVGREGRTIYRR